MVGKLDQPAKKRPDAVIVGVQSIVPATNSAIVESNSGAPPNAIPSASFMAVTIRRFGAARSNLPVATL